MVFNSDYVFIIFDFTPNNTSINLSHLEAVEYIENYADEIFQLFKLKECFLLRLHLINHNKANKSEFEINEADILKYETLAKIKAITAKIKEKSDSLRSLFLLLESQHKLEA